MIRKLQTIPFSHARLTMKWRLSRLTSQFQADFTLLSPALYIHECVLTTTHDFGNWLGLPHMFEGELSPGDGISDTPAGRGPVPGSPLSRDTFPGAGTDPVQTTSPYEVCNKHALGMQAMIRLTRGVTA
jgi:Pregnancy-associated plasma protein-A